MARSAGQKPVHLSKRHGHIFHRDAIWTVIRALREFSIMEIEDNTRIELDTIKTYVTGLTHAGYLEPLVINKAGNARLRGKKHFEGNRWRLIRDVGVEAPRVSKKGKESKRNLSREQMWRTMRVLGEFSYKDLAIQASTEHVIINESTARDYIKYLHKAEYLVVTKPSKPNVPARYRFIKSRYTGPIPPMIQRIKHVFDANLGEVVWPKEGDA